jgi:hypothetical protein
MAAAGKCTDDLLYMVKQCPAACKKCNRNCSDILSSEHCQAWAAQNGCENNPEWMIQHCGKTCGACDPGLCINVNEEKATLNTYM